MKRTGSRGGAGGGQYDGKESGGGDSQQYRQQQQYSSNIQQQQQQQQRANSPAGGANAGPTFEDLTIDECLNDIERIVRYTTSNIALQRLVHVKMLAETAQSVGFEKTKEMLFPLLETIARDNEFVVRQHFAYQLNGLAQVRDLRLKPLFIHVLTNERANRFVSTKEVKKGIMRFWRTFCRYSRQW